MASTRAREPGDISPNDPARRDSGHEGDRPRPTNANGPQHPASRRTGHNVPTVTLANPMPKPAGQERQVIREVSPLRPQFTAAARGTARSRKNSQDLSPTRNATNAFSNPVPSAAAVQRALSANKPSPQVPGVDSASEGHLSRTDSTPRWPISPRLTSPPPASLSRISNNSNRKQENDMAAPNSSQKRASASAPDLSIAAAKSMAEKEDMTLRSGLKTPARGASGAPSILETVAENCVPDTPSVIPPSEPSPLSSPRDSTGPQREDSQDASQSKTPTSTGNGDSESDNGGIRDTAEPPAKLSNPAGSKPISGMARSSVTNLAPTKGKVGEPPTRSMTVETETVSSVPQAPLNMAGDRGGSGKMDANGSIRLKASNEMMKAKKEKKRNPRRPTSINTGTISSKADIFEAKVASAVDEANTSDSDETFVYESNPPEPYIPRSARHHSRTPSATSVASQADQYGGRTKSNGKDGQHSVGGKRSMKFANYNNNLDGEYGVQGSSRGASRTVSTPRHHHISRHSRGPSHVGLFDNDSPFSQANRASSPRFTSGKSRPNSPRVMGGRVGASPRKSEAYSYDADGGVADDERMPLMGSVRVNRGRYLKRPNNGSLRQLEYIEDDQRSFFPRHGACVLVAVLFLILCSGAGSFIMALSRPLIEVSIREIQNTLATEQELMFDLNVRATNPNIFAITVAELNVDVFAKSEFVGSAAEWREEARFPSRSLGRRKRRFHRLDGRRADDFNATEGVDEGNDPIEDPRSDPQTMVLGRVFEFDSPLVFEASPIRRQPMLSLGGIRLDQPGNKTEEDGSARWERVIQHPFRLIVGGSVRYQLPLSSRTRSASVRATIKVYPDDAVGSKTAHVP